MKDDLFIHFPFNMDSAGAVSAARRYITLIEAQLSQAYTDERAEALEQYHSLPNRDEGDYEAYIRAVERDYEDEFRPILRFASVVYLYMIFETHVSRHVSEIQRILQGDPVILKDLKAKNRCGIVEAARIYFRDYASLTFFADAQWLQLQEIACVRHCIVHDAGIPRDSKHSDTIYALESRKWLGQSVGLEINRYQGRDLGDRMILHQRFLEYCLSVVEHFFHTLGIAAEAKFPK
jgi:hypothetical protein